jgi:hypothetical protein
LDGFSNVRTGLVEPEKANDILARSLERAIQIGTSLIEEGYDVNIMGRTVDQAKRDYESGLV